QRRAHPCRAAGRPPDRRRRARTHPPRGGGDGRRAARCAVALDTGESIMQTTVQALAVLKFSKTREGKPVLSVTRRDGTVAWQKQHAFFPVHDLTHYAIETTLGLRHAFWGMMADGWEFSDFGTPWPRGPMPNLPQALLAEASAGWFDSFGR